MTVLLKRRMRKAEKHQPFLTLCCFCFHPQIDHRNKDDNKISISRKSGPGESSLGSTCFPVTLGWVVRLFNTMSRQRSQQLVRQCVVGIGGDLVPCSKPRVCVVLKQTVEIWMADP